MVCKSIIVLTSFGLISTLILIARTMLLLSDFICSWKSEWDGIFEKPEISYKENWDPVAWRFLGYLWFRRYLDIPDQNFVIRAEKLRFYFILSPSVGILTAGFWVFRFNVANFLCNY